MSSITIDAPEARSAYPSKTVSAKKNYQAVIKISVWILGTIIFCLAMVDFYAQTYANETGFALQSMKDELLEVNKDLRISDIDQYVVGSPTVQTRPADKYTHICKQMKQYTWKGFFKTYSISIYLGLGNNPSIDFVHCQGDTKEKPTSLTSIFPK
ncbi:hypothetical protein [uncultured Gimesia sp.]|mgnify:CR=1 FL=1|uniref:hypothetical protein n=1 Tax=uncultured Gimesia sp. TaxID=1678688 RepID=UPI0030DA586F|tara:strand:- start:132509 stop:132973 length:465 start_codon:yes stop_codon:yes gene_type:complete